MNAWTDERLSALRTMWTGGKTAAEIAVELGGGISRNAVLGKVHRLKLEKRVDSWKTKETVQPSAPKRPKFAAPATIKVLPVQQHPAPVVLPPAIVEPTGEGVSIHALDSAFRMCRWIVERDVDRLGRDRYCGEPTMAGCSWCAWHRAQVSETRAQVAARSKAERQARGFDEEGRPARNVSQKRSGAARLFGADAW